ncbi:jg23369 [Pararge aegeria aegeria]|uniref:Jg23369 protein n=1 Tax=Pararge aegeria aegeria TaxID=348720 RepID=A0A8S4RLK6_9NEOP|nr:jg23369 [Pararge aegeria aegeria]
MNLLIFTALTVAVPLRSSAISVLCAITVYTAISNRYAQRGDYGQTLRLVVDSGGLLLEAYVFHLASGLKRYSTGTHAKIADREDGRGVAGVTILSRLLGLPGQGWLERETDGKGWRRPMPKNGHSN